ncbi:MAG: hypothetical protein F6K09_28480, partial [Merismopedia sp. SIO2A8]|nr:hypothetical protein [Merismopedia sp. SIO2A8]
MVTSDQPPLQPESADVYAKPTTAQEALSPKEVDTQLCASGSQLTPTPPEYSSLEPHSNPISSSNRSEPSESITRPTSIPPDSSGTEFSRSTDIDNLESSFQRVLKAIEETYKEELKAKEREIARYHEQMTRMLSIISHLTIQNTKDKEIAIHRE